MLYLVTYDIPDNRCRLRLAKTIKDFGDRVQFSVFECLLNKELLERLHARIASVISAEEDSVRIYPLCAGCEKNLAILGQGELSREEEFYIL